MKNLAFAIILGLVGCAPAPERPETADVPQQIKRTCYGAMITTVEYKGHQYIFFAAQQTGSLCHDPDCPCGKKN